MNFLQDRMKTIMLLLFLSRFHPSDSSTVPHDAPLLVSRDRLAEAIFLVLQREERQVVFDSSL